MTGSNWLVLTATLPTSPSGLRVRVWRALRATGAGTLREGVYVLPEHASTSSTLRELEATIVGAGAEAHLLVVQPRDEAQERSFRALFDRSDSYAELLLRIREQRSLVRKGTEAQLHRMLRDLDARLQVIQQIDFFPDRSSRKALDALASLHREVELHLSPGEPAASRTGIERRRVTDYQGRIWATRKRPWVDRLATAWLVVRFVDRKPAFKWIADPSKCPKSALGFDFDGATFTHVGDKVSFEVMAESFDLLADPGLQRLAALVHYIDIGGVPVDEAAGFEMLMRGLQVQYPNDDDLLAAALPLFDASYAALRRSDEG